MLLPEADPHTHKCFVPKRAPQGCTNSPATTHHRLGAPALHHLSTYCSRCRASHFAWCSKRGMERRFCCMFWSCAAKLNTFLSISTVANKVWELQKRYSNCYFLYTCQVEATFGDRSVCPFILYCFLLYNGSLTLKSWKMRVRTKIRTYVYRASLTLNKT